jgi:hypothetical protein
MTLGEETREDLALLLPMELSILRTTSNKFSSADSGISTYSVGTSDRSHLRIMLVMQRRGGPESSSLGNGHNAHRDWLETIV